MLNCPICQESLFVVNRSCPEHSGGQVESQPDTADPEGFSRTPMFAGYEELIGPRFRIRFKKQHLIFLIVIFGFILAREVGWFNLSLFRYHAQSRLETHLAGTRSVRTGNTISTGEETKKITSTNDTNGRVWETRPTSIGPSGWIVDLQDEIQSHLRTDGPNTAIVEEVQLSGGYWLPVYKSGTCKYRVRLNFVADDATVYTGVLEGTTEFDFWPICSIRTLKETLAKEISQRVIKTAEGVMRK